MEEEKQEEQQEQEEGSAKKPKKNKLKLVIILVAVLVLLAGGGAGAYFAFSGAGGDEAEQAAAKGGVIEEGQGTLMAIDPFVVNLSAPGRYLKVTIHFELTDPAFEKTLEAKNPVLRDAVITLLSSKSTEAVAGPEGKNQLKDEIIYRVNQAVGEKAVKNLYFTEFVMQ